MCKNSQNRSIPSKFIGRNHLSPLFLASWSRHVPTLRRRNPANNCRDVKCHVRYRASQRDAWYYGCYNGYAVARPCAATVFDPPRVSTRFGPCALLRAAWGDNASSGAFFFSEIFFEKKCVKNLCGWKNGCNFAPLLRQKRRVKRVKRVH